LNQETNVGRRPGFDKSRSIDVATLPSANVTSAVASNVARPASMAEEDLPAAPRPASRTRTQQLPQIREQMKKNNEEVKENNSLSVNNASGSGSVQVLEKRVKDLEKERDDLKKNIKTLEGELEEVIKW